jgi:hypothetical protein
MPNEDESGSSAVQTLTERIEGASPTQLRRMARDGIPIPSHPPEEATPATGPGPSDGGTTTSPPAGISLQTEMDPKRVREAAAKLKETRR